MQTQNQPLSGEWTGTKALYLSDKPEPGHPCDSRLSLRPVAMGKFLELSYTWSYQQQNHEGLLLIGPQSDNSDNNKVMAAWIDSWHQSSSIMHLEGSRDNQGAYSLTGSFSVPDSPDWGWRIEVSPNPAGDELTIRMFNVTPAGEATLGVEMLYHQEPCA